MECFSNFKGLVIKEIRCHKVLFKNGKTKIDKTEIA